GRHGRDDLRPGEPQVRVPQGSDLRLDRARGRDQPGLAQDPVRAPRGHGGGSGHGRRRDARRAPAVHGHRDAEPDRAGGHLPPSRGPARPLPRQDLDRLPRPRLDRAHPRGRRRARPLALAARDHHLAGRGRHGRPRRDRARRRRGPRVRLAARRAHPHRARGAAGRLGARGARARTHHQGVGRRAGPPLRRARRRQGPRPARVEPPQRAPRRGRARAHDPARPARAGARRGPRPAGASERRVSTEVLRPTRELAARLRARARVPEPLAERARPVLEVVQPAGWVVLVVGVVAWWAGRHLGWAELVVVGLACLTALAIAVVFVVGRSEYAVHLELTRRRLVVGRRAVGRTELTDTASPAQLPSEVELPVGASGARFSLPRLAAGETYEELFTVPTTRRAVIPVGAVRSVRGDGLGLLRREKRWTETAELFVHPRTVALHGA